MKLLAVETSTEACSAALYIDGIVNERFELAPKEHTKLILPMIDSLMSDAGLKPQQLDALAFSCGPGSFTGVRIATGVIQGIALGADLPVVPVSTLAAIAQDFFDNHSKAQHNHSTIFSVRVKIAAFVPLSLRERPVLSWVEGAGVRVFKKAQIVSICSASTLPSQPWMPEWARFSGVFIGAMRRVLPNS